MDETLQPSPAELEQIRVNYGEGLTPTEQFLKYFGERSFLRFWSHANPHTEPTKELCDLLVVCSDFVIYFSDKSVDFQFDREAKVAWARWYREAVSKSARQLSGAVRFTFGLRRPIYKDKHCLVPLDIPIPPSERAKIYRVAVVSVTKEWGEKMPPTPFLSIDGSVVGGQHAEEDAAPFRIGDVSPDSEFVHVIDIGGLWAVLSTLDTVSDFASYLNSREAFIRQKPGNSALDEWCLLTRYMLSYSDEGDPLPLDDDVPGATVLDASEMRLPQTQADLNARKEANRESYLWDFLIERQVEMIEQRSYELSTYTGVPDAERSVRNMALETRLRRRILSMAWKAACLIALPDQAANIRTVPHHDDEPTTYVFFTLAHLEGMSYDDYRNKRRELAQKMVLASLVDFPASKVVIGIASELGQMPDSYDLLYFDVEEQPDQEQLKTTAREEWEFKKKIFGNPVRSEIDEREVPPS